MADGINQAAIASGAPLHCVHLGGMFTVFFGRPPLRNLAEIKGCDAAAYARFFRGMLERDIYLPPSSFETCFISAAHTEDDIARFLDAAGQVLASNGCRR